MRTSTPRSRGDRQQQRARHAGQRAARRASCTARHPPTTAGSRARPPAAGPARRTAAARRRRAARACARRPPSSARSGPLRRGLAARIAGRADEHARLARQRRRAAQAQREAAVRQLDARKPAPLGGQRRDDGGAEAPRARRASTPSCRQAAAEARPVRAGRALVALVDEPRVGGQQRARRARRQPAAARARSSAGWCLVSGVTLVTTLLIDNYDSYTFNLYQLIASVAGEEPVVVRNDEIEWEQLAAHPWDRIVVSPGPGRPERERDLGIGRAALAQREIPVLGVCLGHQGLAHVSGASVVRGEEIVHGRISRVFHRGDGLFAGIAAGLSRRPLPLADRRARAAGPAGGDRLGRGRHADGDPRPRPPRLGRAVSPRVDRHRARRAAHRELHRAHAAAAAAARRAARRRRPARSCPAAARRRARAARCAIAHRVLDGARDAERAFAALFGDREHAFWLDSSRVDPALSRFSFMGAAAGELGAEIRYRVGELAADASAAPAAASVHDEPLLAYLSRELARLHTESPELPFDLNGGFVGYLGYELKADCGAAAAHTAELPDAFLLLADRLVVVDHALEQTHVLALSTRPERRRARRAQAWLAATAARLDDLPALGEPPMRDHARGRAGLRAAPRARALPGEHRDVPAPARGRRELRDLPDEHAHAAGAGRPVRASTGCCGASTPRRTAPTCGWPRARC